jgi:hypothetical protein
VVVEGRRDDRWATWGGDEVSCDEAGSKEVSNSEVLAAIKLGAMICHDGREERRQERMILTKSAYLRCEVQSPSPSQF